MLKKCSHCGKSYMDVVIHECLIDDLKSVIEARMNCIENLTKLLVTELAWTFSISEDVVVKVEFHSPRKISKSHVMALSAIFAVTAENYVSSEANKSES